MSSAAHDDAIEQLARGLAATFAQPMGNWASFSEETRNRFRSIAGNLLHHLEIIGWAPKELRQ